ncbi:hypothetical protein ASPCAL13631 [Aspergillus calidoustus]|uniref:Uncharacterized protein n=1 Tax=Aspergillus calidoustus TaxID=454130 RepID=A0A0U5GDP2_ASPCI|nr:hypothetical protein ASPCAL13631 [Aspergillus calidoustus]
MAASHSPITKWAWIPDLELCPRDMRQTRNTGTHCPYAVRLRCGRLRCRLRGKLVRIDPLNGIHNGPTII